MESNDIKIYLKNFSSLVFLALGGILLAYSLVQMTQMSGADVILPEITENSQQDETESKQDKGDKAETKYQALAKKLKEESKFTVKPPEPQPPSACEAILGRKAYFPGQEKGFALGDEVPPGAKIIEIGPTFVKLKWQEREITLYPIKMELPSSKGSQKSKDKEDKKRSKSEERRLKPVFKASHRTEGPGPSSSGDDLSWFDVPDRIKDKLRPMWNALSDEEKQKRKTEWENMSEEKKSEALGHMENMPDM